MNEVIIIGSGPAGLTAAIYSARAGLKPILFAGLEFGGQLMTTTLVENYPGFPDGVQGPELMQNMLKQAEKLGTVIKYALVDKVDFSAPVKKIWSEGTEYQTRAVIVATGANPKKLNIESETKYWGKGVSSCATCDGAFYRGKEIAVVGGGDTALEEALFLTRFASKVSVIHRRDQLRASKAMQERAFNNPKIEIVWNKVISEILGDEKVVTGLKLTDTKDNSESQLSVNGLFLGIGHLPSTKIFTGQLELDEEGYIVVKEDTKTSVAGVFVAGDVKDHKYRQAITAAGMGCQASLDCEKWLGEQKTL